MTPDLFLELTFIVLVTVACSLVARGLKQPLIIGYILAAVILGPHAMNVVTAHDAVAAFSEMGVAFLLFMVGLNLNPGIIRQVGKIAVITGIGQVLFTSFIGYFLSRLLHFDPITALYVAVSLTFSSTIVIMKLLSDMKALETLYGKISIGFLIVQDLIAMLILILVSTSSASGSQDIVSAHSLLTGAALVVICLALGFYALPIFTRKIAASEELLFLFCIAWCLTLAAVFKYFGFSIEIGALLAGVTLSTSPYRHEIALHIRPLRDFFLILFFVFLGTQMTFADLGNHLFPIAVFSLFILIGNPLIVMILMGSMGYTKRTGLLSGFTVAQISEFSLILMALGVKLGHVKPDVLSMVTVVGLITIAASTYMMTYGKRIYKWLSPHLNIFERKGKKTDRSHYTTLPSHDILMIGYSHIGMQVISILKRMKKRVVVVDHDPEAIARLISQKVDCVYGDAEDGDILSGVRLRSLEMLICTTKDFDVNLSLISQVRSVNRRCVIIAVSEQVEGAISLYEKGATYVIMPHFLGGAHTSLLIEEYQKDLRTFLKKGVAHRKELKRHA